jgi:hypothetical protein
MSPPGSRKAREKLFGLGSEQGSKQHAMQVHAEGEAEHAAIGHDAVVTYVPASHEPILRRAMLDHDRCAVTCWGMGHFS